MVFFYTKVENIVKFKPDIGRINNYLNGPLDSPHLSPRLIETMIDFLKYSIAMMNSNIVV